MKIISKSYNDTLKIAKKYAKTLQKGDIVLLEGDLGAGKTVFAKGVISAFSKAMVVSPTFTLVNQYKGKKNVNHFDLYRIENADELENIGASELLFGDSISLVEWPSRKQDWPQTVKKVDIIKSGENERTIIFE